MVSYLDQIPEELRDSEKKAEITLYLREAHDDIEGGGTIDGTSTASVGSNYGSLELLSDGTDWFVI